MPLASKSKTICQFVFSSKEWKILLPLFAGGPIVMSPFIIQSHMSKGTWEAYIIYPKLKFNIIFPVEICPYRKQLTVSNGYQNDELFKIYIYITILIIF